MLKKLKLVTRTISETEFHNILISFASIKKVSGIAYLLLLVFQAEIFSVLEILNVHYTAPSKVYHILYMSALA